MRRTVCLAATVVSLSCGIPVLTELPPLFPAQAPTCAPSDTGSFCYHWDWCDNGCDWVISCTGPADARARAVRCSSDRDCEGTVAGSTRQYCGQFEDSRVCMCKP